jgi:hypothetical protein
MTIEIVLTTQVDTVFIRYLMIVLKQYKCNDDRMLGEIFFFLVDEMVLSNKLFDL